MENLFDSLLREEERLLLALLVPDPGRSPHAAALAASHRSIDWDRFAALVERHRIGGIIASGVRKACLTDLPSDLCEWLDRALICNTQDFMRMLGVAGKLAQSFRATGIQCAMVKGLSISSLYYPDASHREMIDLDIIVRPEDFRTAQAIVEQAGFYRHYPKFELTERRRVTFERLHNAFAYIRPSDRVQLDLHWRMARNPALLPNLDREWPMRITQCTIQGVQLPVLTEPSHFVFVIAHGAKSGWSRLKWLADADRMIAALSQHEVEDAAKLLAQYGLEQPAAEAFELCRVLLGTRLPDSFETIRRQHLDENQLRRVARIVFGDAPSREHRLADWKHYVARFGHSLGLRKGGGYRRAALLREIARPADIGTIATGPALVWLLVPLSPILGVSRAIARLVGVKKGR